MLAMSVWGVRRPEGVRNGAMEGATAHGWSSCKAEPACHNILHTWMSRYGISTSAMATPYAKGSYMEAPRSR